MSLDMVLSILVLAAFASMAGAIHLWRKGGSGKQAALLALLAAIMLVNVAIWTIPGSGGTAPVERAAELAE